MGVDGGWKQDREPQGSQGEWEVDTSGSESSRRGWPVAGHVLLSWGMTRKGAMPLASHLSSWQHFAQLD